MNGQERNFFQFFAFWVLSKLHIVAFLDRIFFSAGKMARAAQGGLPVLEEDLVDKSYLLLAPFNTGDYKGKEGGWVYLVDLYGTKVHAWSTQYQTSNAQLLHNGNLAVAQIAPDSRETSKFPGGGRTGILQILDWQGGVVWEYANPAMHHDFEFLPNGNILLILWEEVREPLRAAFAKDWNDRAEKIWTDVIVEITPEGRVVSQWHAQEHLDIQESPFAQFPFRVEWTHTNAVRYIARDPFEGKEAFLLSMRNTSTIYIISKNDGKIVWKSPKGMFMGQHDPTCLPNGNILAFDNSLHRLPSSRSEVVASRVVEVDPRINDIVWQLDGGRTSSEKARMYASVMCGAQRLSNGNTHITLTPMGHMFEVTPDKKLVWDFVSPYATYGVDLWPNTGVFTSRRYHYSEIEWPELLPPPLPSSVPYIELFRSKG